METEAKAKVVVSVWGAEFVQFLAALVVLRLDNSWAFLRHVTIASDSRQILLGKYFHNATTSTPFFFSCDAVEEFL